MKIKPDIGKWYGLNVEGAKESVMDRIKNALSSIYSNEKIPMIVYERLEKELKPVRDYGFASEYYIASEITRISRERGYLTRITRQMGASYVFFLLGVTDINPLERHYHCGKCCYYEEAKAIDYGIISLEGNRKECPMCGTEMEIVAEGIPFETYAGEGYTRIPDIGIHIAPEVYWDVFDRLVEIVGENHILRGATIKSSDDENPKEISVEPSAIHLFPRDISVEDVTGVVSLKDDRGEPAIVSSDYDRYDLGMSFSTIDLIVDDSMSLLRKLEEETGCTLTDIPMTDPDTLQLIIKGDTDGIPVFEEEETKKLISLANSSPENNVGSYSSLCRILAIQKGTDSGWWSDTESRYKLIAEGKLSKIIVYRDEVYTDLLAHGLNTSEVEKYTKYVRRGCLKERMVDGVSAIDRLLEKGIDEEYIDSLANVSYLQSKSWVFSEMNIIMKIAYYKTHYPDQFMKVVDQMSVE